MVRSKFKKEIFPKATILECVDELTLRAGEEGMLRSFINTTNVGTDAGHRSWASIGTQFVRPSTEA